LRVLLAACGCVWIASASLAAAQTIPTRPHIVFILADDLGWGDVGYHGSEIPTPTLDRLASEGVRLEQYYTPSSCTPTRASLMTGRYPFRYGLQQRPLRYWDPVGLPLE
jgi:arylsulfatase A-like enzyme